MLIHGDDGHSCYDASGNLTCVIARMLLAAAGPGWQEMYSVSADNVIRPKVMTR